MPASPQRVQRDLAADAVHRGQRHPHVARRASDRRPPGGRSRATRSVSAGDTSARAIVGGRARHRRFDVAVGRRDDLHAAVEVDLVAVVGGRVVRRGDLHAGGRAQVPHGERHAPASAPRRAAGRPRSPRRQALPRSRGRSRRTGGARRGRRRRSSRPGTRSLSTLATAQLALVTVSTFMPSGPSRIGPRSPAVPKVRGDRSCVHCAWPGHSCIVAASPSASLRSTGATSISRSNSRSVSVSRIAAFSHASRSARSAFEQGDAVGGRSR